MRLLSWALLLFSLLLAGCSKSDADQVIASTDKAQPAIWKVTRADNTGGTAWLMGTVHLLPSDLEWQSAKLDSAIDSASHLVVEAQGLENQQQLSVQFAQMGISKDLPALSQRVLPDLRARLDDAQRRSGIPFKVLDRMESWAAALTLAAAASADLGLKPEEGVERVLTLRFKGARKPIVGLETVSQQFGYFDRLSEADQRAMLNAVLRNSSTNRESYRLMLDAWLSGNNDRLLDNSDDGILATPSLRMALLTGRNRNWANQIAAMIDKGDRPLVAVGAAHLAGKEGVQALLEGKGYRLERLQ